MQMPSLHQDDTATLAILPGLLCDSRMFESQLAEFPGCMVVDGFYEGQTTIAGMATYALQQLPERFALLGHSMGARVALEIVRIAPQRVTRLALSSTGVHPVQDGEAEKRFALRDLGRNSGIDALVDAWLPPMLAPANRQDNELLGKLHAMCASAGIGSYERQIEALLGRPELEDLLPRIQSPTLVIVGELDHWSPVDQHRKIAERIPNSHLRIVADAGHMLPAEAPECFNSHLREWQNIES